MIGLGFILALAGIIVLIAGAAQAAQNRLYANGTDTVSGTITRMRSRKLKNGTSYELTVSYLVNGTTYEKIVGSSLTEYKALHEGDSIELLYKQDNPKKAIRPTALKPRNARIPLIIGTALLVAGVAMLFVLRLVNT